MSDFFKFEDKNMDFPFYNGTPKLNTGDWSILLIAIILDILVIFGLIPGLKYVPSYLFPFFYCLVLLIPIIYVCRGKYGLIFKKPEKGDIKVIILCFIAYFIFSAVTVHILSMFGFEMVANPHDSTNTSSLILIISLFVQLMGEELLKVIMLIMSMAAVYHFTENRKTSMICGIAVSCLGFGLIHMGTYGWNLVQCILIIGVGCIIHFYPYIKTKNVMNSYLTHVLIDIISFLPILFSIRLI